METTRDLLDRTAPVRAICNPESDRDRLRRRNAVEASLRGLLPGLGLDELRILERQAEKMLRHKREYGELVIDMDTRDLRAEAADEHRDALFYMLVEEIKRSDARADRLRCEAADELSNITEEGDHAHVEHPAARCVEHDSAPRILAGLRELRDAAAATPHDWPGPCDLSDIGGEGGF